MKTFFEQYKKGFVVAMFLIVTALIAIGASGNATAPLNAGTAVTSTSKAFVLSQVDTIYLARERGLTALSFGAHWKDSMSITRAVVRRIVDGQFVALVAGDTLTPFSALVGTTDGNTAGFPAANGSGAVATITMAPLCDQYAVIVTYASSAQGFTTPTVKYEFIRQYASL